MDDTFSGFAFKVSADGDIAVTKSLTGAVIAGKNFEMTNSSTTAAVAGADINLYNSSVKIAVTGNTQKLKNSRVCIVKAGGDAEVRDSKIRVLAGSQVTAQKSVIGLVLARQVNLGEGSQVLVNTRQAVAFGTSLGIAFAVICRLLNNKK
jgi:hypothetical protein